MVNGRGCVLLGSLANTFSVHMAVNILHIIFNVIMCSNICNQNFASFLHCGYLRPFSRTRLKFTVKGTKFRSFWDLSEPQKFGQKFSGFRDGCYGPHCGIALVFGILWSLRCMGMIQI